MHQNSEAKQPKETDEIKKKLESYAALHRRIDNQIERLENLEAVMGSISSPSFDEMEKPDEQTVLEMHYFDAANWWTVCAALHGSREDYDEHEQRYLKRTFKLHGSALQSLARIYRAKQEQG